MLASARKQHARQARVAEMAVHEARRKADSAGVVATIGLYQAAAVEVSLGGLPDLLSEQGITTRPAGSVIPSSLLTPPDDIGAMLTETEALWQVDRLVKTLVTDAARTATGVDMAARSELTGHVRYLNPPSCGRCTVLAGRVYRWSTGFLRHPGDDCVMLPTTAEVAPNLITNPRDAYERGQVSDLSQADRDAIDAGADLGQVVNVRRKEAGLRLSSSVIERAGRPTPAGIFRMASDRAQAIELLRRFNYLTS